MLKQVCSLPCAGALLRYCTSVWLVLTGSAGRVSVPSEHCSGKARAVIVLTLPVGSNKTCKSVHWLQKEIPLWRPGRR